MKTLIIFLITVAISILPIHAAGKVEANPINIAYTIAEKTDSAKIVSTLAYYGYAPQISQNNNTIYLHPNGSEIDFSFEENGVNQEYPIVRALTKTTEKDKQKTLSQLKFKKIKN